MNFLIDIKSVTLTIGGVFLTWFNSDVANHVGMLFGILVAATGTIYNVIRIVEYFNNKQK